jgi:hypothetical protein
MADIISEARRLHDDDQSGDGLELLAGAVLPALAQDLSSLPDALREVLEDCSFGYLLGISSDAGVDVDPERPMEEWVRAINKALPRERRVQESTRLAMVAIGHLLNMIAHEKEIGADFPAVRAGAGVFAVGRLSYAGRHQAVLDLANGAAVWMEQIGVHRLRTRRRG